MEQWAEIRRRVLVEKVSQRQILRETGMHWKTLRKILGHSEPPVLPVTAFCTFVREFSPLGAHAGHPGLP